MKTGGIGGKSSGEDATPDDTGDAPVSDTDVENMTPDELSELVNDGEDLASLLESTQKELEEAQAVIRVAETDDLKAEAIKWKRINETSVRRQNELMDSAARKDKELTRMMTVLRRIGRAVGEDDTFKIAAAVEAFVASMKAPA